MRKLRALAVLMTATVVTFGLTGTAGASEGTGVTSEQAKATLVSPVGTTADNDGGCLIGNINNGSVWTAYAASTHSGKSKWYEYGDKFEIIDTKSDGYRTIGFVNWCKNGAWVGWKGYNSGPNEGDTDSEVIDFGLAEGRRVAIFTCRMASSTSADRCGSIVYANA